MVIVPLQAVPSQLVAVSLGGQNCKIAVAQKTAAMFVDLYVDDAAIITGVIAETNNAIVRSAYLGFNGDIAFIDLSPAVPPGSTNYPVDPYYQAIGTRFLLAYFPPSELTASVP
jgi:hypothetical protein